MVSQSDLEPIISPTSGSGTLFPRGGRGVAPRLDTLFELLAGLIQHQVPDHIVVEIVLVGHPHIIQRSLLQLLHLTLVLDLENQIADSAEAFPVVRSDAVRRESGDVLA